MSTAGAAPRNIEPAASLGGMSAQSYAFLQSYIARESGIVIEGDKRYLIEARLQPVLRRENIHTLDALCLRLAAKDSCLLGRQVVEAMTTNETLFFRDKHFFQALQTSVLPDKLLQLRGTRKLRIWSAAASSGQEAYSVAMQLHESGYSRNDVEIVGTDLSEQVLERAREGRYLQFEVGRGLTDAHRSKYFSRSGLNWQLRDEIRSMVTFRQLDLRSDLSIMGCYDLILCRNVLIYFSAETKRQILASVRNLLVPDGLLALGCSESVSGQEKLFARHLVGQFTFYSAAHAV